MIVFLKTILFRLNTIMDSNRVIVLDAGRIAEFNTPDKLMKELDNFKY